MIWGRNAYTLPPAVFPSTCASLLPPCPYTWSFLWPLANEILLIRKTIQIYENKLELYLTLPVRHKICLSLSVGGRCAVVSSLLPHGKVLNMRKATAAFRSHGQCWVGRVWSADVGDVVCIANWTTHHLGDPEFCLLLTSVSSSFKKKKQQHKQDQTKTRTQDNVTFPLLHWYFKYQ